MTKGVFESPFRHVEHQSNVRGGLGSMCIGKWDLAKRNTLSNLYQQLYCVTRLMTKL